MTTEYQKNKSDVETLMSFYLNNVEYLSIVFPHIKMEIDKVIEVHEMLLNDSMRKQHELWKKLDDKYLRIMEDRVND